MLQEFINTFQELTKVDMPLRSWDGELRLVLTIGFVLTVGDLLGERKDSSELSRETAILMLLFMLALQMLRAHFSEQDHLFCLFYPIKFLNNHSL